MWSMRTSASASAMRSLRTSASAPAMRLLGTGASALRCLRIRAGDMCSASHGAASTEYVLRVRAGATCTLRSDTSTRAAGSLTVAASAPGVCIAHTGLFGPAVRIMAGSDPASLLRISRIGISGSTALRSRVGASGTTADYSAVGASPWANTSSSVIAVYSARGSESGPGVRRLPGSSVGAQCGGTHCRAVTSPPLAACPLPSDVFRATRERQPVRPPHAPVKVILGEFVMHRAYPPVARHCILNGIGALPPDGRDRSTTRSAEV